MRGVISAGMISALETLGLTQSFDAVYGSSAGAINAAYFLAGQARLGTRIYFEDINNRRFIHMARALRGHAIVDLDFLLGEVAVRHKPLDTDRVLRGIPSLSVIATEVTGGAAQTLGGFDSAQQLFSALRASATMPVVAGDPHVYRGRPYLDASLTEPIPVPTAEAAGHTIVVTLLTREGAMKPRPSAFDRYFVGPRLRRISPPLAHRYLTRAAPYAALLDLIKQGIGPRGTAQVFGISVPGLSIGKLECRSSVLRDGAQRGYEAVLRAFDVSVGSNPFE
jgi:predicted patatin/cPLA2 family phospholipase